MDHLADRTHAQLKARHRAIRDESPEGVRLRVHRALSWLQRAERERDDLDAAFLFHWIAFNAAYAADISEPSVSNERADFGKFFRRLIEADRDQRVYEAIWTRYSQEIRLLLDNRYVFPPYWKHLNGIPGFADWHDRLARSRARTNRALAGGDVGVVLETLFDRLYMLRNQLVHGGATWNGAVNREQVRDGARILGFLVPLFIELIMEHPDLEWGVPNFPVID